MTRRALPALIALAMVASLAGCLGGGSDRVGSDRPAEVRNLTILDAFSGGSELTDFLSEVTRLSHGTLRIRIVRNEDTSAENETAAIRAMQDGRADLGMTGTRAWDEFGAKRLRALVAPLLIDNYPLEERVLSSDLADPMLAELRPLGFVGVGILPGPMRLPFGVSHRLAGPSDFAGLTIGTQQSRVADATMRALGATPRRMPPSEGGTSGIDGFERQTFGIQGDRMDVKGSHLTTNLNLWPRPLLLFASERTYRNLTTEQWHILREAAANAVSKKITTDRRSEGEAVNSMCQRGQASFDSATPAEVEATRRAVQPVYRGLERDPGTRAAIRGIERLKRQMSERPAVVPTCTTTSRIGASDDTTELDGVWNMDTDRSASAPEYLPENWGHWVFAFDRGRFAITQENRPSCTWGYGKFTVKDNRTSWTFTDGGGIAPSDAMNKPGEFFVFDFSAYRDTMKLTPVPGEISPRNFIDKPWRRLSATPTRGYFSKRCPPPADALPKQPPPG